jgi:CRP/FNR family cyclic AMP-dependent transcriptional regulator
VTALADALREHPFLAGLPPAVADALEPLSQAVTFEAGDVLAHEGDVADTFFLLTKGRVQFDLESPGKGDVVIGTLGAGDALGWSWAVAPHRWTSTARATKRTRGIAIDGGRLRALCAADHELGFLLHGRLMATLASRLSAARVQLLDVYANA